MVEVLTPEFIFSWGNKIALVGWIVLAVLPRPWPFVLDLPQLIIPFLLGLAYVGLFVSNFGNSEGDFNSIAGVRSLFESDATLAAGWLHYLAFDLFVGAWIAKEADSIGLHRLFQIPILFLTLMFGPAGLVLFLVIRTFILGLGSRNQS